MTLYLQRVGVSMLWKKCILIPLSAMRACGAPWQVAPRPVPGPARRAVAAKAKGAGGGTAKPERVDRILSRLGYCSRADAKKWVKDARVTVDGVAVARHDVKVLPTADGGVRVDDQPLDHPDGLIAVLHKPKGVVCSHDEREGPNVYGLLPPRWRDRNPSVEAVGRLDKDTTGLLLLTDDGALSHRLTSPKKNVWKTYEVTLDADVPLGAVEAFAAGTLLLEGETSRAVRRGSSSTLRRSVRVAADGGQVPPGETHDAECGVRGARAAPRAGRLTPGRRRKATPLSSNEATGGGALRRGGVSVFQKKNCFDATAFALRREEPMASMWCWRVSERIHGLPFSSRPLFGTSESARRCRTTLAASFESFESLHATCRAEELGADHVRDDEEDVFGNLRDGLEGFPDEPPRDALDDGEPGDVRDGGVLADVRQAPLVP